MAWKKAVTIERDKWRYRKEGKLYLHPFLMKARSDSEDYLELFLKNMEYLLKKRELTRQDLSDWVRQVKDMDDVISIPKESSPPFMPDMYTLQIIANFVGESVIKMLSVDIEQRNK